MFAHTVSQLGMGASSPQVSNPSCAAKAINTSDATLFPLVLNTERRVKMLRAPALFCTRQCAA